jgi:uncharacterized membrane protein YhaH (DUF805 family)
MSTLLEICSHCGKQVLYLGEFCPSCGKSKADGVPRSTPAPESVKEQAQTGFEHAITSRKGGKTPRTTDSLRRFMYAATAVCLLIYSLLLVFPIAMDELPDGRFVDTVFLSLGIIGAVLMLARRKWGRWFVYAPVIVLPLFPMLLHFLPSAAPRNLGPLAVMAGIIVFLHLQDRLFPQPEGRHSPASGSLKHALFSFAGRTNLSSFWVRALIPLASTGLILTFLEARNLGGRFYALQSWLLAAHALLACCLLAAYIKRCHDRNRSAWFLLVALIPVVGALWLIIEMWFVPGTSGANRFGDNPSARESTPPPDIAPQPL